MSRYAITGPSTLRDQDYPAIMRAVRELEDVEEIITGAAPGTDTFACLLALIFHPQAKHTIVVPAHEHNHGHVALMEALARLEPGAGVTVLHMPLVPGTESAREAYRQRNVRMVELASDLVAFVRRNHFYRSGEWMTVNIARKALVPVLKVVLP